MGEHRDSPKRPHDDIPTEDETTHDPRALAHQERREGMPRQPRPSHDDVGRADAAGRNRWRFSSAVEAARHLRSR